MTKDDFKLCSLLVLWLLFILSEKYSVQSYFEYENTYKKNSINRRIENSWKIRKAITLNTNIGKVFAMSPALMQTCSDGSTPPAPPSYDCSEYFTTGDTGDVAGNTEFDAELDASSKLSIVSNKLVFSADTSGISGYVSETTCTSNSDTEITIKGTVEFSDITGVDDGITYYTACEIYDDANTQAQVQLRFLAVSGNVATYKIVFYHDGGTQSGNTVTMTGIAADTSYNYVLHWRKNLTTGGASVTVGEWETSTTSYTQDNDGKNGGGTIRHGGCANYWGDGTTDITVLLDLFEVYKSDAR